MIRAAFACLVVGILLMVVVDLIWLGVPLLFTQASTVSGLE